MKDVGAEIGDKRVQHLLEKGLSDVYKKIAGDDVAKSLGQLSTVGQLGGNSNTGKEMASVYLDRVKEILRDEVVREKELYITKLQS
jgi:hypothetical protein